MRALTKEMRTALNTGGGAIEAARVLVQLLAPFAPHAAEQLWRVQFGETSSVHTSSWPSFDPGIENTVTMLFMVDEKVCDTTIVPSDTDEARALELARASEKVVLALGDREIVKEIVRTPRIVNLVTRRAGLPVS